MKRAVAAILEAVLAAAVVAGTALGYGGFFTGRGYLVPVLAAAAGALVLAGLAAWRRLGPVLTVLLAVVGFAALATYVAFRSTLDSWVPTARTADALGPGLLHGWARMLSVSLPADPTGDLVVTPMAVTWAAVFVTVTLVLRTRARFAALLPAAVALAVSLLVAAGRAGLHPAVVAGLIGGGLLLVVVRAARLDAVGGARGRVLFGVPVILVVTGLAVAGARLVPLATGADRFDPRSVVPLSFATTDTLTPLVTLKSQLRQQPARPLFTVRLEGGPAPDRIRTAALDSYDGAVWTSGDRFLVAGRTLAADPALRHPDRSRIRVEIQGLPGPYLPAVGWPVRVDATGLGFSSDSGVLVSNGTLPGLRYDLVGEVAPKAGLDTSVPGALDGRYLALPPGLPPEVQTKAAQLAGSASRPYAKLTAIQDYLRKLPYSLQARPGHSYDAIARLFGSNAQDRVGYAEQYASAFAVMARSQGFPTRVAVGYLLRPAERTGDTYQVTTADAHAWPEVYLAGHGWVSFEPTDFTVVPGPKTKDPPTAPAPGGNGSGSTGANAHAIEDPSLRGGGARHGLLASPLLVPIALAGSLLVLLLAVVLEKARRRLRRRRAGGPNARVVGAWRDSTDRLVEHGVGVPASLTAGEVAVHAAHELGDAAGAVAVLAPLVTAAVFSPEVPPDETVREAWRLNARLRRDLRRRRGLLRSVRAWFDPRPLVAGGRDRRRRRRSLESMRRG